MERCGLPIELVSISLLFCSPSNPRLNDAAVPHVAASLRRFGWQQPVVARRTGEVIAGNTRLKAAQSLGMTEVPVWWFEGSDLDATSFAIADNRTHEFAQWNDAELVRLLEELRQEDALDGVGFAQDDIDVLVAKLREQEQVDKEMLDDGPDEPPIVAAAKPGDLWVLGEHRLLCGDSTNLKDVHEPDSSPTRSAEFPDSAALGRERETNRRVKYCIGGIYKTAKNDPKTVNPLLWVCRDRISRARERSWI